MANDVTQDALMIAMAGKDLAADRPAKSSADSKAGPSSKPGDKPSENPPQSKPSDTQATTTPKETPVPQSGTHKSNPANMSFFGLGRPQPTSAEKIAAVEQEMKLMADMHNRMIKICSQKCIPTDYREGELNKGESVCLDRCAAKFFEAHQVISSQLEKVQQERGGGAGGGFGTLG